MANKIALVAENSYDEFEILNELLTSRGLEVHWAKNGTDAVDQFESIHPDLLILDALLSGLTGIKVCQKVRQAPGGEKVRTIILSTVYKQFKDKYDGRKTIGVDAYAEKPVDVGSLERLIATLMGEDTTEEAEESTAPLIDGRKRVDPSGSLEAIPFPKILYFLKKYKRTGALRVEHELINKIVYVQSGNLSFVSTNQSSESLGRYMVQTGVLGSEDYNTSLEKMLTSGQQQGRVLLDMNVITPHQLYESLSGHLQEKVLSIFAWETGKYAFRTGKLKLDNPFIVEIDLLDVIYHGIKRFYNLRRLEGYFNEYKNYPLLKRKKSLVEKGELVLKPAEAKFHRLISSSKQLGQLVTETNLSLTETFQLLYFLILIEEIRFEGDIGLGDRSISDQEQYIANRQSRRKQWRETALDAGASAQERLVQYRDQLDDLFDRLNTITYFELLSVTPDTPVDMLKARYYTLVKIHHPAEEYAHSDDITKAKADGIFRTITEAYEVLSDPDRRKEYMEQVKAQTSTEREPEAASKAEEPTDIHPEFDFFEETVDAKTGAEGIDPEISWDAADQFIQPEGDTEDSAILREELEVEQGRQVTIDMAAVLKSELEFQRGEDQLSKEQFDKAFDHFTKAIELNPKEAEYHAYLGWVGFQNDPENPENVEKSLNKIQEALSINPNLDMAYYFFGMIALFQKDVEKAKRNFQQAVQFNLNNEKARRALLKLEN